MSVVVQVKITDDAGTVTEEVIVTSDSQYAWEITRMFERLGETMSKKIDPSYEG